MGLHNRGQSQASLDRIVHVNNVESKLMLEMRATLSARMIALRNLALTSEPGVQQSEQAALQQQSARYAAAVKQLHAMFAAPGGGADRYCSAYSYIS